MAVIGQAVQEEFLMAWLWNFLVFFMQAGKLMGCSYIGVWGLFWYDDNGLMMENCLLTAPVGAKANYIVGNTLDNPDNVESAETSVGGDE